MKIAIIGAGFFGCTAAIVLSKKHKVDLFESSKTILNGASRSNQFRFHYGFHYPKSKKTVDEIKKSKEDFIKLFGHNVLGKTKNKYLIAKNSKVSFEKYKLFLKKYNLNFNELTSNNKFIRGEILTDERILNYFKFKKNIEKKLFNKNINLQINTKFNKKNLEKYDKVIIFSYANNNSVLNYLGIKKIRKLRYELVEKLVVKLPKKFKNNSDVVIYGKFVCIDPYLGTDYHLLSDVKLSKIEIIESRFPKFKNKNGIFLNKGLIINYNKTRFNKILNRCKKYLPYLKHAKYIGSFYVIRTIKTGVENTDQRTSEIINHNKKIISVMSGKWNNCVSLAKIIYKILG